MYRRSMGPEHTLVLFAELNLAMSLDALGRTEAALATIDRALAVLPERLGPAAPLLGRLQRLRLDVAANPAISRPSASAVSFLM